MNLKLLLTALLLVNLSCDALAGSNFSETSKRIAYIDLGKDKADEYAKSEINKASSGIYRYIVTKQRLTLLKQMRKNHVFVAGLASKMYGEFQEHRNISEDEQRVKSIVYFIQRSAEDGKNIERSLGILEKFVSSSPVGAGMQSSSTTITRMRP